MLSSSPPGLSLPSSRLPVGCVRGDAEMLGPRCQGSSVFPAPAPFPGRGRPQYGVNQAASGQRRKDSGAGQCPRDRWGGRVRLMGAACSGIFSSRMPVAGVSPAVALLVTHPSILHPPQAYHHLSVLSLTFFCLPASGLLLILSQSDPELSKQRHLSSTRPLLFFQPTYPPVFFLF